MRLLSLLHSLLLLLMFLLQLLRLSLMPLFYLLASHVISPLLHNPLMFLILFLLQLLPLLVLPLVYLFLFFLVFLRRSRCSDLRASLRFNSVGPRKRAQSSPPAKRRSATGHILPATRIVSEWPVNRGPTGRSADPRDVQESPDDPTDASILISFGEWSEKRQTVGNDVKKVR